MFEGTFYTTILIREDEIPIRVSYEVTNGDLNLLSISHARNAKLDLTGYVGEPIVDRLREMANEHFLEGRHD